MEPDACKALWSAWLIAPASQRLLLAMALEDARQEFGASAWDEFTMSLPGYRELCRAYLTLLLARLA